MINILSALIGDTSGELSTILYSNMLDPDKVSGAVSA
jgi:hypothetical protein